MKIPAILVLIFLSAVSLAQTVPSGMTYQGRLTDASNTPVPDGTGYEIEVRLWSASTGGTLLWGTRYTGVPLKSGAFNLILGSGGTPISGATHTDLKLAFNTSTVHLGLTTTKSATGVAIPSPTEIFPRQQIFSTPYAFRAESASRAVSSATVDTEQQSPDVASAQTTDLGAITGAYVRVTGSANIASLGTAPAGSRRIVVFTGSPTLTHNASSLILPNARNFSVAAGDVLTFVSGGAGNWRCIDVSKAVANLNTATLGSGFSLDSGVLNYAEGLGVGQSWQNMTATRLENTTYQNTTGKPIQVYWSSRGNVVDAYSSFSIQVSSDNVNFVLVSENGTQHSDNTAQSLSAIIPNNHYYRFVFNGGNSGRTRYIAELR